MEQKKDIIRSDRPDWMNRVTTDELERLGAIGYKAEQLAMYFHVPRAEFMYWFLREGSWIKYHYERGRLMQQAREGMNMMDAAVSGENVTQAQRFDKLRREVAYRNCVSEIFFGDVQV